MARKDSLSDRMKGHYENRSKNYLTRRMPVIIRLDGKAFHTFTKGLKKPYDTVFHNAMNQTTQYLCKHIQGCKLGYTQSDEITLLLTDFDTLTTDAWFDYAVQKMCSIAASLATLAFNRAFELHAREMINAIDADPKYVSALNKCMATGALFDARCFNVPEAEVVNCFIWRQQDGTRNAIQMLGQTYFSTKQLDKKNTDMIQEMLWQEHNINFNDMPTAFKRGVCCYKRAVERNGAARTEWYIDTEIPIFTQTPEYINCRMTKE